MNSKICLLIYCPQNHGCMLSNVSVIINFWCLMSGQAVIENISLKQQIFSDLEKYCPPHCILASNTSTIDLNLIGEKTKTQDRIVGAHFFRWYLVFVLAMSF